MVRISLLLALLSSAAPTVASEPELLCLGLSPKFVLTARGAEVTFDYNGDGTYRLEPPLRAPGLAYQRHELVTRAARWPLSLDARDCRISTLVLPLRVEIRVPTDRGQQRFLGCCLWKSTP
jgi:hypothetical protein